MRIKCLIFIVLFIFSSCGSLKLTPKGCQGEGSWGDEVVDRKNHGWLKFSEDYYIWFADYEIALKEFLKKRNINCHEVKKLRIDIGTYFFVKRELTIYIQK